MNSLFMENRSQPLADRLRPKSISQIVGQDHLLAVTAPIGRMLSQKRGVIHDFMGTTRMW